MPINMSPVVTRMFNKIEDASAFPEIKNFLMLAYDPSPWTSEIYMTVTKNVPGAEMSKISGTFASMVFDGPYNAVPKWISEMDAYLASKSKKAKKYYVYYTTCPKCAKKYGHNYVVAFAEL
jgi:NMD protein affecting ribosome stability and mRNA decay